MASQGDHVDSARILLYHKAPVDDVTVVGIYFEMPVLYFLFFIYDNILILKSMIYDNILILNSLIYFWVNIVCVLLILYFKLY